jgi:hypothetical protein
MKIIEKDMKHMQAQAFDGYFENGQFYPKNTSIRLPGRFRAVLTILDIPDQEDTSLDWIDELERMIKEDTSEKLNMANFPRIDFGREPIVFSDKE